MPAGLYAAKATTQCINCAVWYVTGFKCSLTLNSIFKTTVDCIMLISYAAKMLRSACKEASVQVDKKSNGASTQKQHELCYVTKSSVA